MRGLHYEKKAGERATLLHAIDGASADRFHFVLRTHRGIVLKGDPGKYKRRLRRSFVPPVYRPTTTTFYLFGVYFPGSLPMTKEHGGARGRSKYVCIRDVERERKGEGEKSSSRRIAGELEASEI